MGDDLTHIFYGCLQKPAAITTGFSTGQKYSDRQTGHRRCCPFFIPLRSISFLTFGLIGVESPTEYFEGGEPL